MCSHGDLQVQVDLPSLSSASDEPQDTHSLKHVTQALGIGISLPKTSSTVSSTKTDFSDVDMNCVCVWWYIILIKMLNKITLYKLNQKNIKFNSL